MTGLAREVTRRVVPAKNRYTGKGDAWPAIA